jgi:glycosyltransferase involved in cell wall biosynthesis
MPNPLVSVCMITYNHEGYIEKAIEGVLMQEVDFEIEFIIADDSSLDQTSQIVKKFIENHPNGNWIKYIRHPENKGMIHNFVWVLKRCKGKYIALCEGDDYWLNSKKLCEQVVFLERNPKFVLSFHDCRIINDFGEIINENRIPSKFRKSLTSIEVLKYSYFIPTLSVLFRNIDIDINSLSLFLKVKNGDMFLFSYLSKFGRVHYHSNIKDCFYRINSVGSWSIQLNSEKRLQIANTFKVISNLFSGFKKIVVLRRVADEYYELGKMKNIISFIDCKEYFIISLEISLKCFYFKLIFLNICKLLKY